MDINKIYCKSASKTFKADKMFKVKSEENDCIEEIVSYRELCPFSESGKEINSECKKCYGTIAQSKKIIKIEGKNKNMIKIDNYKNIFKLNNLNEYIRNMDADRFMEAIDIVCNLNALNWSNDGQKIYDKLRAYDKPKTWKTDCIICKKKCSKNNSMTECEKAEKYLENKFGIPIGLMSEKQLTTEMPNDCICKNQAQTMYFI